MSALALAVVLTAAGHFFAPVQPAGAQYNRLQTNVTSKVLTRFSAPADSTFPLNATANDTTTFFRPAKWTALQFKMTGTTPDVDIFVECGNSYEGTFRYAMCDTVSTVTLVGNSLLQLSMPTAERARVIFDGQTGSGADVVIDSVSISTNW